MLLTQDRVLGETIMHMVPSCSPQPPTFDASQLDFDLDLLPADCQVPSLSSPISPFEFPVSPTMFSDHKKERHYTGGSQSPTPSLPPQSPYSLPPQSPYSPARRGERSISGQSGGPLESTSAGLNLHDSLLEFTTLQDKIKQEQDLFLDPNSTGLPFDCNPSPFKRSLTHSHNYPLSPPPYQNSLLSPPPPYSFHSSPSSSYSSNPLSPPSTDSNPLSPIASHTGHLGIASNSNALLKQCLSDTSFQQKYNLKPFDFGVTTGFVSEEMSKINSIKKEPIPITEMESGDLAEVKIEPVLDLAVEQVKKDIKTTCEMLGISSDPHQWSTEDFRSWLCWTVQQFSIPMSLFNLDLWNMDKQTFFQLREEDFMRRLPQGGDIIYAQFDIWRRSAGYETPMAQESQVSHQMDPGHAPSPCQEHTLTGQEDANSSTDNYMDIAYMLQMLDSHHNPVGAPQTHYITPKTEPGLTHASSPPPYPDTDHLSEARNDFGADMMDEEEEDEEETVSIKSPSRPGTTIHLWQFIKELLLQPQHYGNFIHWLDRQKGIFKIVDSVKVATLWGKRKNRPAMNYDKLSRSLRQYYKKGIMKKTERSQRLVYQFCHPYHL